MINLETIRTMSQHNDWANGRVLEAAGVLNENQLDQPIDMGRGSLRKTLLHILCGESVWVKRWQGKAETPWPDEEEKAGVTVLRERLASAQRERDEFLGRTTDADLLKRVDYRDSAGGTFTATLGEMMLQLCLHSAHHRAQAVNMIRRVGGNPPDLDYMYSIRKPADGQPTSR